MDVKNAMDTKEMVENLWNFVFHAKKMLIIPHSLSKTQQNKKKSNDSNRN